MTADDYSLQGMPKQLTGYTRAEFRLETPGILFQFKLRQSEDSSLFALVSKNSRALARLKAGTTLPMTYYHRDKTIPPANLETRIRYIRDAGSSGTGNTLMVGLEITR